MMTEQEKYYARKNQQAKDFDEAILPIAAVGLTLVLGWIFCSLLLWMWPVTLFCIFVFAGTYIIKYIKDLVFGACKTLYNFLFRRKLIQPDTLQTLDALAILAMLFFVIVLMISITLK